MGKETSGYTLTVISHKTDQMNSKPIFFIKPQKNLSCYA